MRSKNHQDIHVLNRAQLLDDAFSLARAGMIDYTTTMNLTIYLDKENNNIPWETFMKSIRFLNRHLYGSTSYNNFKVISYFNLKLK